jgi:hypothetical protein
MTALKSLKQIKLKKCRNCKRPFRPYLSTQKACGVACAKILGIKDHARKIERARLEDSRRDRARLEQMKTARQLMKEAQREFNAFIRERDRDRPCICCGRFPMLEVFTGSGWDAGHYRSMGAAAHLRFNEDNCHRQLKQCNRYGSGRAVDYRIGLIKRIGLVRVEALEHDNAPRKWSTGELRELRELYRRKTKDLRARRELGAAA